ncbi:hypothetical protein AB0C01_28935 [Micromonospora sp. NPDC048905]|uniref:hypothetical protein n=1 Tax=Micromonospora sp. NPDC048905 TaxID=3155494 RepID=UPI0033DFEBA8
MTASLNVTPRPAEVSMQSDESASKGEQLEAAEREAAKQRLLAQAEADRVPVDDTTRAVPDRRWRRDQR